MDQNKRKAIVDTRYEEMNREEFASWLQKANSKLLWFSYRELLDIAAKYTAVHGQEKEYPKTLIEALDITSKVEVAEKKKTEKKKYRADIQHFPEPANLREDDCWQGYN